MKNKIKIFRKLVRCASIALLSFSMAGCGADFLDTTPTNNISGSSIWTKATLAEQAVIGVYNVFLDQYCPNSGILDSHRIPWDAYSSVMDTDKNWIKRMPNCTGAATPSSGLFSDIYKRFYTFIYRANDVIDNIGQVPDMSTGEKQRAIAECKFLRAFAFLVAVIRTPLTAIVLITEITGHLEVFYPSIVVGGLTYYFTEMLQIKPFNVILYDDMIHSPAFKEEPRYTLSVEVMSGSYLDGKIVDELRLPERCVIINVHRDRKNWPPKGQKLMPGDQVQIEMDSQDIEKLYEPLVSMANIY